MPGVAPGEAAAQTDESALVAAVARGDAQALAEIYARHGRSVYSLALHLLRDPGAAEEVVQETFLKLWRRPEAYQATRGRLAPWLLGVTHHHAVDLLRRRRLEQRHQAPPAPGRDGHGPVEALEYVHRAPAESEPDVQLGRNEQREIVRDVLADLPPAQRVPLELAYYGGLSQTEIAEQLGEPLGTIKTRMRLALQRLRGVPRLVEFWESPAR